MSAALHKQTYTGLKPSGSFIKIKTATTGGVSGLGSDSAGFPHRASISRDTPAGTEMEPFDSTLYSYSRDTIVSRLLQLGKVITHHNFHFVFLFDKKYKYLWCTKISQVICYK